MCSSAEYLYEMKRRELFPLVDIYPVEMLRAIEVLACRVLHPYPHLSKKDCLHSNHKNLFVTLYGKTDVADVIKVLKMLTLAWTQFSHMNP